MVLQVSDTAGCNSYDTAWFYVHPTPPAPSLRFCGNPCITDGPVTLCSSNGLELFWSNGTRGASTHYFTDGLAGAYRIDMATGCKSSVATIQIPEAPSFDGVLTGCYCLDDDAIPSDIPLYSLGVSSTLPWEWTRFASPVMNGIIPPAPAVLPLPEVGEYNLVIPDYGLGCHTVSPSLVIENWGCKNSRTPYNTPSVWCAVTKKVCELTGCKLQYEITVRVCNRLEDPVCIDNIHSILPVAYSVTSGIPLVLNPGECQDVVLRMEYDFSLPSTFPFLMTCSEDLVGGFTVGLSDWTDCVHPDTCYVNAVPSLALDTILSRPGQSAFFNFGLTFPTLSGTVISAWCDHGQIIGAGFAASTYSGLLMLDYGLMTQLVVDSADFCFHIVCCDNDKICTSDICIPYRNLWDVCGQLDMRKDGQTANGLVDASDGDVNAGKRYLLVPNPANRTVSIVRTDNQSIGDEIQLVEVFSMTGQKVMSQASTSQLDISCLQCGAYIVKVVTSANKYDYLKLIKQ